MRLLFGVTLLCAGISLVSACVSARVETYRCLTDFFNDTAQTVPRGLERILGQASRKGSSRARIRRDTEPVVESDDIREESETFTQVYQEGQDGGGGAVVPAGSSGFQEHWCGPFESYVSCMEEARERCESAGLYTCSIMTTFAALYGTYICDLDIKPWVATSIPACKESGAPTLLLSPRMLMFQVFLVWRLMTSY